MTRLPEDILYALVVLNDLLCERERATGLHYTLVMMPHSADEYVHVAVDGKPVSGEIVTAERAIELARAERDELLKRRAYE